MVSFGRVREGSIYWRVGVEMSFEILKCKISLHLKRNENSQLQTHHSAFEKEIVKQILI